MPHLTAGKRLALCGWPSRLWKLTIPNEVKSRLRAARVTKVNKTLTWLSRRLRPRNKEGAPCVLQCLCRLDWREYRQHPGGRNDRLFGRRRRPPGAATATISMRIRSAIWSIQSPSGYKRIIVGQGHLAKELSSYEGAGASDPDVVYLDDGDDGYRVSRLLPAALSLQGPQLHVWAAGRGDATSALPIAGEHPSTGELTRNLHRARMRDAHAVAPVVLGLVY